MPRDIPVTLPSTSANSPQRISSVAVCEPDTTIRDVLTLYLEQAGYRVTPLTDGAAAIEWLSTNRCDIVLMDVAMPRMNGIEALAKTEIPSSPAALRVNVMAKP